MQCSSRRSHTARKCEDYYVMRVTLLCGVIQAAAGAGALISLMCCWATYHVRVLVLHADLWRNEAVKYGN